MSYGDVIRHASDVSARKLLARFHVFIKLLPALRGKTNATTGSQGFFCYEPYKDPFVVARKMPPKHVRNEQMYGLGGKTDAARLARMSEVGQSYGNGYCRVYPDARSINLNRAINGKLRSPLCLYEVKSSTSIEPLQWVLHGRHRRTPLPKCFQFFHARLGAVPTLRHAHEQMALHGSEKCKVERRNSLNSSRFGPSLDGIEEERQKRFQR